MLPINQIAVLQYFSTIELSKCRLVWTSVHAKRQKLVTQEDQAFPRAVQVSGDTTFSTRLRTLALSYFVSLCFRIH